MRANKQEEMSSEIPNPHRKWRQRFASRKFILTCAIIVGVGVLLWFGKIGPDNFERIVISVAGLYLAANVGEVVAERPARTATEIPTAPPLPVKPIA
jgi:hypothetical protein